MRSTNLLKINEVLAKSIQKAAKTKNWSPVWAEISASDALAERSVKGAEFIKFEIYPDKQTRDLFVLVGSGDLPGIKHLVSEHPNVIRNAKNYCLSDGRTLAKLAEHRDDVIMLIYLAAQGIDISEQILPENLVGTAHDGLSNLCQLICLTHAPDELSELERAVTLACENKHAEIVEQLAPIRRIHVLSIIKFIRIAMKQNDPKTFAALLRVGKKLQMETKGIFKNFLHEDIIREICKADLAEILELAHDPVIGQYGTSQYSLDAVLEMACEDRAFKVINAFWPRIKNFHNTKELRCFFPEQKLVDCLEYIFATDLSKVSEQDLHDMLQVCNHLGIYDFINEKVTTWSWSRVYPPHSLSDRIPPLAAFLERALCCDRSMFSKRNLDDLLRLSARLGSLDILKRFIKFADPHKMHGSDLLREACYRGEIDKVRYLLVQSVSAEALVAAIQGLSQSEAMQGSGLANCYCEIINTLLPWIATNFRESSLALHAAVEVDNNFKLLEALLATEKFDINEQLIIELYSK